LLLVVVGCARRDVVEVLELFGHVIGIVVEPAEPSGVALLDRTAGTAFLGFPPLVATALLLGRAKVAVGRGSAAGRGLGETTPRARAAKAAAAAAGPRPTESTTGPRSSEATSARAEAAGSFLARTRLTYREAAAHEGLLVEALDGLF